MNQPYCLLLCATLRRIRHHTKRSFWFVSRSQRKTSWIRLDLYFTTVFCHADFPIKHTQHWNANINTICQIQCSSTFFWENNFAGMTWLLDFSPETASVTNVSHITAIQNATLANSDLEMRLHFELAFKWDSVMDRKTKLLVNLLFCTVHWCCRTSRYEDIQVGESEGTATEICLLSRYYSNY